MNYVEKTKKRVDTDLTLEAIATMTGRTIKEIEPDDPFKQTGYGCFIVRESTGEVLDINNIEDWNDSDIQIWKRVFTFVPEGAPLSIP